MSRWAIIYIIPKKAKRLALTVLAESIEVLKTTGVAGDEMWLSMCRRAGFDHASLETRKRVIEILGEIAI